MHVTEIRIRRTYQDSRLKALVSVTVDGDLAVHDIKVIEGPQRLFVAMPSRKDESGTFRDKIYTDVAANVYYPSLFLMDCGIFYTIRQRVTLALNIDNLLDKEYFKSATVYGKPRSFSATVSCRF